MFKFIPRMFKYIPRMFRDFLLRVNIVDVSNHCWLEGSSVFISNTAPRVVSHAGVRGAMPGYEGLCRGTRGYAGVRGGTRGYAGVRGAMPGYKGCIFYLFYSLIFHLPIPYLCIPCHALSSRFYYQTIIINPQ